MGTDEHHLRTREKPKSKGRSCLGTVALLIVAAAGVTGYGVAAHQDPAYFLPANFGGNSALRSLAQDMGLIPNLSTRTQPTDADLRRWSASAVVVQAIHKNGLLHLNSTDVRGEGTGFFSGGHLITADHVVYASDQHAVDLNGQRADISGEDHSDDLAVLNAPQPASVGSFQLLNGRPGLDEALWAFCATTSSGNQTSHGSQTLHLTVQATNAVVHYTDESIATTHDLADAIVASGDGAAGGSEASPGCSGAPVVNGEGKLVGMLVAGSADGWAEIVASQHLTQFS